MSLAGLLTIVDDDPQLHDAIARAEAGWVPGPGAATGAGADGQEAARTGADLVAPPTLRPVLAAALTRGAGSRP